jgi:hypothetical protein
MKESYLLKSNKELILRTANEIIIDGCKVRINFSKDPNENILKNMKRILFYSFASNQKDHNS